MTPTPQLSAKDERIADLFASGYAAAQIASDIGSSVTTVYNKLRNPLIKARIAEARAAVLRPIRDLVLSELRKNVEVLAAIRDADDSTNREKTAAVIELNSMFFRLEPVTEEAPLRARLEAMLPDADASTEI